ncbi:hypothetical protein FI667_g630, partial [Globisporangium splendens]
MKAAQDGEADTATVVKSRRRRRLAPVTLEEKRARQRAYVKKSYYRQLNAVNELKEQVRLLETEYARIIGLQTGPTSHLPRSISLLDDGNGKDNEESALVDVYAQLTLQKEELRKENEALKATALTHAKFQRLVGLALDAEMCQQITITAYNEILTFQRRYSNRESTGANVLGWRDERCVLEDDRLQFSVRKLFHGRTAAELSQTGWRISSTSKVRSLYAESIDIQFHVLQQVDADNVIMYRILHSLDGLYVNKTLLLATLFRTETGYIALFRSLDPEGRILAAEPESETDVDHGRQGKQHRWLSLYTWVIFDEVGENGEHCLFDFNGILPAPSSAWMLEMLLVAMRWENIVVGPIFKLQ